MIKYSDCLAEWLCQLGYTHCFYVGGGNIMHLVESLSRQMTCIPVIHEVAAGIAAEYFNGLHPDKKALALVTAGPGLSNIVTAIAAAFAESRELLVIGGQVKTADLSRGKLRQRGIQEIDGVSLVQSITKCAERWDAPVDYDTFYSRISQSWEGRKGPVFIEIPIDVQGIKVEFISKLDQITPPPHSGISEGDWTQLRHYLSQATRPLILVGGGVDQRVAQSLFPSWTTIPIATTWNGADRISADHPLYVGRPNTWGQRSANLILQQSDCVIALGTRLGMQQTGFNWQEFVPHGVVIHVDIDPAELEKGHPRIDLPICADANDVLRRLATISDIDCSDWIQYCRMIRSEIPVFEPVNTTGDDFISPYHVVETLSTLSGNDDVVVPCSSGSAFTIMMQVFTQKGAQRIITNKGMASMGYGLSGAIGAAFAAPGQRVILVEGDGGFAQNLQEIGTAAINQLNLKIFIFDDSGYASIRMTQRNYFGGRYVGCDRETGLGLPNWQKLFDAWGVPAMRVNRGFELTESFQSLFNSTGPAAFIVSVDPDQTYFPKITSRILENGQIVSNPLHLMTPELDETHWHRVAKYIK